MVFASISNEMLLILHVIAVCGITLGALALGKEALITTLCFFSLLSNLFIAKQITLFGLNVISTDVYAVGSIFVLNLLQEYFGKSSAQKAIIINMGMLICYLLMSRFALWYTPNIFDSMQTHFVALCTPHLRIIIASISVYVLVQYLSIAWYGIARKWLGDKYLATRNVLILSTSQLLDTTLFSITALYGIVHSIIPIIVVSFSIKMFVIMCSIPFVRLTRLIIKPHQSNV